jgi:exopolysaccharide biosynthesis polyprenyl glycosylphosphotransferase
MKSNASLAYNLFLVIGDFLALVAAFVGAYFIRSQSNVPVAHPLNAHTYVYIFLGLLPFWILIFALLGLYNSTIYERRFSEFGRLLVGSFIGMLFVIFWNFLSVDPIFPAKLVPLYGMALAFVFLVLFRNIARLVRTELFGFNIGLTHIALVGSSPMTRELVESLANSRQSGYKVVAVVGDKRQVDGQPIRTYPTFKRFLESVPSNLHSIIQTELYADEARNAEILTYAQENHVGYRFVPGNTELFVGNLDVELFRNSVPVIAVRQTPLFGWGRVVKRLFDIAFGTVLLAVASPIILIISLVMVVFDHGDPFWRNKRLSRFGTEIGMYKFRTQLHAYHRMTPEQGFAKMGRPELAKQFRANGDFLENDPRISRLGRFLRKTSLDELPQLLNVIKGDMSLVGPRPLEPFELSSYDKKNLMLSVKTGITGLAVVSGRRDISFEERRKLDLYYVQNWTFWLDIIIILKTVRAVFDRRGAR